MTPNENGFYFTMKDLLEEPAESERYISARCRAMGWSSYGWLEAIAIYKREKESQSST